MPILNAVIVKLDDVEEALRGFYVEKDGKFVLQVNGVKTQADVDTLTRSLQAERSDHVKTKAKVTTLTETVQAWVDAAGENGTPETIKSTMEKVSTLEAAGGPEITKNFQAMVTAEVNKIVDGRVKSETTKLQRQLDASNTKVTELTGNVTEYKAKDDRRTVIDAVRGAADNAKVRVEALPDILAIAGGELKLVDGKVITEDGRDPSQWFEDRKKASPYFWPAAKGAGAAGSDGLGSVDSKDNPFTPANHNMTKISALVNSNPTEAAKLAAAAGVPKGADGNFIWHQKPAAAAK